MPVSASRAPDGADAVPAGAGELTRGRPRAHLKGTSDSCASHRSGLMLRWFEISSNSGARCIWRMRGGFTVRRTVARQLSPDYPFYNRPGNDHRHFLAYEGTRVVGRASAMVNAAIRDEDGAAVGLVGFFECVKDPVVATVLLDAARDWLRDEHGLRRIWGR